MMFRFMLLLVLSACSLPAFAGPLHDAAASGDLDALRAALSQGADPDEPDASGRTAIMLAAKNNHAEAISILVSEGADANKSRENPRGYVDAPIHTAVREGNLDAIRALAEAGADIWISHYEYGSPIHIAITQEDDEATDLLRSFGADELQIEPVAHLIADADLEFGRRVAVICSKCHEIEKGIEPEGAGYGRLGPSLINIVGKPKGADPDYPYTDAMRNAGGSWTYEDLSHFVVNPTVLIPGTDMWIGGLPIERPRAALLAYLRSITENPPPLPE